MRVRRGLPWLYAAPMLAFVGAVFLYPVVTLVRYSLENVGQSQYVPTTFAGLANFRYIFSDSLFLTGAARAGVVAPALEWHAVEPSASPRRALRVS